MREVEHQAELFAITPVEISSMPREGYREVASFLLNNLNNQHRMDTLERLLANARSEMATDKKMAELAYIDKKTGALNDRAFDEYYPEACKAAQRDGRPLAVFYFDIDGLKRVNDDKERAGYEKGDELIKLVASMASTVMRARDKLFRIGGDEFVVVTPYINADQPDYDIDNQMARVASVQERFAHTFKRAIQRADFIPDDLFVGVSVGSALQRPNELPEVLRKRAEVNMEHHKNERREELAARGVTFRRADDRLLS